MFFLKNQNEDGRLKYGEICTVAPYLSSISIYFDFQAWILTLQTSQGIVQI